MIGVIIARFQTPYLHPGHINLIDSVKAKHKRMVIVLGVSPVLGSKRNPLDFHTREKMIKNSYPDIVVLPLPDHPLDEKWSASLDTLLSETFPASSFTLYGGRNSFINFYTGRHKAEELPAHGEHSASELRNSVKEQVMDSVEFRSGIIYAYANTYAKVYPTVDIAVFRNDKKEILLGKKANDQKWRLLGGFSDPTDANFEAAALRELYEECGNIKVGIPVYEGSFLVDDWRYRNETDKIITTLFSTEFESGSPVGSDDIAEVRWFKVSSLPEMIQSNQTTETHTPLFNRLIEKYNK